jgi:hypothetical protein
MIVTVRVKLQSLKKSPPDQTVAHNFIVRVVPAGTCIDPCHWGKADWRLVRVEEVASDEWLVVSEFY